jgi:hypothetical protein
MNNKPVLNLFHKEDDFSEYLAKNLSLITSEKLTLIDTKYSVKNPRKSGADGELDILAKDDYGNFVIIEVKRSDKAARQTLNELAKYTALFMEQMGLMEENIRCFVVSTEWHELDLPLSYFRQAVSVDVKGFTALNNSGQLLLKERQLIPPQNLPRFSPETRFFHFDDHASMLLHAEEIRALTASLVGLKAALITLIPLNSNVGYRSILCIWRIQSEYSDQLKIHCKLSHNCHPYPFAGWEEEADVLEWITQNSTLSLNTSRELARGTPEKIAFCAENYDFTDLVFLGDQWQKKDLINDVEQIKKNLIADSLRGYDTNRNRYRYKIKSSPKIGPAWTTVCKEISAFVAWSPFWQQNINEILSDIDSTHEIIFHATDDRHFYFRAYQACTHSEADLAFFELNIYQHNQRICSYVGGWAWDEKTQLTQNEIVHNMLELYDSVGWQRQAIFSAVDENRYDEALLENGFLPWIVRINTQDNSSKLIITEQHPEFFNHKANLKTFLEKNPVFCQTVKRIFYDIPTQPCDGQFFNVLNHSFSIEDIHNVAALLFWKYVKVVGIEKASDDVIYSSGNILFEPDGINNVLIKYNYQWIADSPLVDIFASQVKYLSVNHAEREENMYGFLSEQELTRRKTNYHWQPELNKQPVGISGIAVPQAGTLIITPPLPAIVELSEIPQSSFIQIENTVQALGFPTMMYIRIDGIQEITDYCLAATGIFYIPVPDKETGILWREVIPNSTGIINEIYLSSDTGIRFKW